MSSRAEFYTVYGINLNYDDAEDFIEQYYDYNGKVSAVIDGMSGKYVVIGTILWKDDQFGDGAMSTVNLNDLRKIEADFRKDFMNDFPDHVELINKSFELIMFTHWR